MPLQKCILKHIRKIRRERCKTSHRMESRVLHCLFFMLLGYMPDLGLDKVISSMFFSPETDKNLMEQTTFRMTDCFAVGKWCNVLLYESLFIARLCVKWRKYRSALSSEFNSGLFFTSLHFSCKRRLYESLVVESHLQSTWGSSLSLSPACNTKPYYYLELAKEGPWRNSEFCHWKGI